MPVEHYAKAVVLVEPDGSFTVATAAVFGALAPMNGPGRGLPVCYQRVCRVRFVTETVYSFVAAHRVAEYRLTQLLWGRAPSVGTYGVSTWIFLRLLGLVFFAAFASLWVQIDGLVGSHGILPLQPWLEAVHSELGVAAYYLAPTLSWLDGGDAVLHGLCVGGMGLSVLLVLGVAPVLLLILLWGAYLSLVTDGREFLTFQWDLLLLETGFLSVFLAPLSLSPWRGIGHEPPRIARWLLWWLLFRLNFMSGMVKRLSGDPTWRNLTALDYHFFTQPLPPWTAWHAQHWRTGVHAALVVGMYAIELAAPFLIVMPRYVRHLAAVSLAALQAGIAATGNYGFFNVLAITLCVLLLDDAAWPSWLRRRVGWREDGPLRPRRWPPWVCWPVGAFVLAMTGMAMMDRFQADVGWPRPLAALQQWVQPFASLNGYGLFAVMTTTRQEIVIEGSRDGVTWAAYEFKWKPGDVNRRPAFVQPHMPRLDWRMWFAPLEPYQRSPWYFHFLAGLLRGSPEVKALLANDPFPGEPPRYLRSTLYAYRFSRPQERAADGAWWVRTETGPFCPTVRRRD